MAVASGLKAGQAKVQLSFSPRWKKSRRNFFNQAKQIEINLFRLRQRRQRRILAFGDFLLMHCLLDVEEDGLFIG